VSVPPKPASASATIGANQSTDPFPCMWLDLIGAQQGVVDPLHQARHARNRIEALVGYICRASLAFPRHLQPLQ